MFQDKWSNKQTMEVIDLYKKNYFLWDVEDEKYKLKKLKDDMLKRFSINRCQNMFTGTLCFYLQLFSYSSSAKLVVQHRYLFIIIQLDSFRDKRPFPIGFFQRQLSFFIAMNLGSNPGTSSLGVPIPSVTLCVTDHTT